MGFVTGVQNSSKGLKIKMEDIKGTFNLISWKINSQTKGKDSISNKKDWAIETPP